MLGGLCLADRITLLLGVKLYVLTNKDHPTYSNATSRVILSDKREMSNCTETVMQFTDEHVNKRFQAHMYLYCVIIGYDKYQLSYNY